MKASTLTHDTIVEHVNEAYSAKARSGVATSYAKNVAKAFGYTEEQLESVPDESHLGLSCGNPVAAASIKEGETVIDLGSGGGIDVFLAAAKAGPSGKAIGLDMSLDMIALARKNASAKGLKPPQVAFVHAQLAEALPIESCSTDCILSNCVINLLPFDGKAKLFKEAHRILKPQGRIVLDDIIAKKPLPDEIKDDLTAYVGCISGAILLTEYEGLLKSAGFSDVLFVDTKSDLNAYYPQEGGCCSVKTSSSLPKKPNYDVNEWVASYQVYALKSGAAIGTSSTALLHWWDAYPTVKSTPPLMTDAELAALIRDPEASGEFAVIDVRRNDHAGGHVRGSHNWPAQTFYDDLPVFFEKFRNTPRVIFYCQSSQGRGPRCAGWYQDFLDTNGDHKSMSYTLKGGVKNWLTRYSGEQDLSDRD
ncbi:S-adenosyl-L-methionine-dependent methyltransferase [Crassisporium funariophilum]|nr:S-adenosyl-L-methionine-dependent methyltransferase [Crassisporium funariophilum]